MLQCWQYLDLSNQRNPAEGKFKYYDADGFFSKPMVANLIHTIPSHSLQGHIISDTYHIGNSGDHYYRVMIQCIFPFLKFSILEWVILTKTVLLW